jgi:hypothetical protein
VTKSQEIVTRSAGGWTLLGDAHQVLISEERQQIIEIIRQAGRPLSCRVMALELEKKVDAIRKCVQRMVRSGHLVITDRGLYDVSPMTNTPVLGVLDVPDVPGVPGVLGDSGQEWDRVGQWECSHLTNDEQRENVSIGQVGQGGHHVTSDPVHDSDQDIAERFDAVSPADDEPPPLDEAYAAARGEPVDDTDEEVF